MKFEKKKSLSIFILNNIFLSTFFDQGMNFTFGDKTVHDVNTNAIIIINCSFLLPNKCLRGERILKQLTTISIRSSTQTLLFANSQ